MQRFSKPLGNVPAFKHHFLEQNSAVLERATRLAARYRQQPERTHCKICEHPLSGEIAFHRYQVPYKFCLECGHLNGGHEDTPEYADAVYLKQDYGSSYRALSPDEFTQRVQSIYLPKAEFLRDMLIQQGENLADLHIADFGAGSGHFIAALSDCGLKATGFEISASQVEFSCAMLQKRFPLAKMETIAADTVNDLAGQQKAPIVSMIGVLEHLCEPTRFLEALRNNRHTRYLFLSVPLFSFSVYLETAFPGIAPRVLEGGHTHLFTPPSIEFMERRFRLRRIGEWWFGLDIFDLFRLISLSLSASEENAPLAMRFQNEMLPMMDCLQETIDQRKLCSEVHLLYALPAA